MTEYRARLDAEVTFSNGGGLSVHGFLVDVPRADLSRDEAAQLLLRSLGLLMAGSVEVRDFDVIEAPHKGTRGGPADRASAIAARATRLVELNHVITEGMITYPGLPAPTVAPFLTREESRARYAEGTEFALDCITLIGNTGTYLDSPYHRFDGGTDLAGVELSKLADLPAVVLRVGDSAERGVSAVMLEAIGANAVAGAAVLLHTGDSARFGTRAYAEDGAYLARDGAQWLAAHGAALVGIDSVNIDAIADGTRPAHTLLLAAGIPVVEHLTGLEQLPPFGARFSAVPPRIANFGTFPVRAFAAIPID